MRRFIVSCLPTAHCSPPTAHCRLFYSTPSCKSWYKARRRRSIPGQDSRQPYSSCTTLKFQKKYEFSVGIKPSLKPDSPGTNPSGELSKWQTYLLAIRVLTNQQLTLFAPRWRLMEPVAGLHPGTL